MTDITCPPAGSRCKHTRVRLVTEGPQYGIWQCKSCDHRVVRGQAQLSLFSLGEAQLGALQEPLPECG